MAALLAMLRSAQDEAGGWNAQVAPRLGASSAALSGPLGGTAAPSGVVRVADDEVDIHIPAGTAADGAAGDGAAGRPAGDAGGCRLHSQFIILRT